MSSCPVPQEDFASLVWDLCSGFAFCFEYVISRKSPQTDKTVSVVTPAIISMQIASGLMCDLASVGFVYLFSLALCFHCASHGSALLAQAPQSFNKQKCSQ